MEIFGSKKIKSEVNHFRERKSLLNYCSGFFFLGPESRECDLVFGGVDSH